MTLSGVHLLLTYQCNLECAHCFVWGSPWQSGTMGLGAIEEILEQSTALGTVDWVYFEGGEAFLFYPILRWGVEHAAQRGFKVGIVSNGYWATTPEDAEVWLKPLAGLVHDLSLSSDLYHSEVAPNQTVEVARGAAQKLGIPVDTITITQPEADNAAAAVGQLPPGESKIMYRGRAARDLVGKALHKPWTRFTECPYEDLSDPGRVHIDPFGHVHICQGISLGNVFEAPLSDICAAYDPNAHPITGPLLDGGPVELAKRYRTGHDRQYADACHFCYETRRGLRERFPDILAPDQMYGVAEGT